MHSWVSIFLQDRLNTSFKFRLSFLLFCEAFASKGRMKNIDKKTKLNKSQIENLAATFPSYYLGLFKQKIKDK